MILQALQVAIWVVGPILAVSLVAGLLVGVAQTVLQINEASVSFIVVLSPRPTGRASCRSRTPPGATPAG